MLRTRALWGSILLVCLAGVAFAEEDEGGNPADFSVAMMLLATVTFMMSTFYLVNMEDEDLRQAAWMVISSTISIFAAVLLFQAVNETVAYYILGTEEDQDNHPDFKLLVNFVHAALWYLGLQCVLAHISQAVTLAELKSMCRGRGAAQEESVEGSEEHSEEEGADNSGEEEGDSEKGSEDDSEEEKVEKAEMLMKCWATLFGHITGFACINAFGTLQGRLAGEAAMSTNTIDEVGGPTLYSFFGVLIALAVLRLIFTGFDHIRDWIAYGDDGKKDKMEELWDTETEETEDDVLGLTISFTTVQVFRYMITGVMPNEEGEIECEHCPELEYTSGQAIKLIMAGCAVFLAHVARTQLLKNDAITRNFGRLKEQFKVICGMIFAWCFFFGMQWIVGLSLAVVHMEVGEGTIAAVILAMVMTFLCYLMIFGLDKIADADWTDKDIDKSIRELIGALGILIGFAWEKSFDAAVVSVAGKVGQREGIPPPVTKLALSILICFTVIPAWLWYILPELKLLGVFDEEDEEEEEAVGKEEEDEEAPASKPAKEAAANLNTPLLNQAAEDKKTLSQLKKDEKDRMSKLKDLQKEIKKNSDQATKINQDIQKALTEVSAVKQRLQSAQ